MMGYDDAAGMGLQLGGDILSQVGAAQGARAMAAAQEDQLREQLAFQKQANQRLGLAMSNNNPWTTQSQYTIQSAQPGQSYIAALGHAAPVGLSTAGGKAFQARAGANTGELQAAAARLRQVQGLNRGEQKLGEGMDEAQSDIAGIRKKAGEQAGLYGMADQVAAGNGMPLRMGGQLMSTLGGGLAGGGAGGVRGLFGGGSTSPNFSSPNLDGGQVPQGGWMTRRIITNPDGSQTAVS